MCVVIVITITMFSVFFFHSSHFTKLPAKQPVDSGKLDKQSGLYVD